MALAPPANPLVNALRSEEGRAQLKKVFESLDVNGDGSVSSKEWGKGVRKHHEVLTKFFGGATVFELGKQFKQLDIDGSDSLTWDELLGGAGVAALFAEVDTDGSGAVSRPS